MRSATAMRRLRLGSRAGEAVKPAHRRSSQVEMRRDWRRSLPRPRGSADRGSSASSSMRPITGTGSRRSAAASAASARPCPRSARAKRQPGAWHRFERQAPEPIWLCAGDHLDRECRAEPRRRRAEQAARASASISACRAREQAQRRQPLGQAVGIAVELQRRLERREPDLVERAAPASSGCG